MAMVSMAMPVSLPEGSQKVMHQQTSTTIATAQRSPRHNDRHGRDVTFRHFSKHREGPLMKKGLF